MAFGAVNLEEFKTKPSKQGGKFTFGLNSGILKAFGYNPNAGKGGTEGEAFDALFEVGGREFRVRLFKDQRIYSDGTVMTGDEPEYEEKYNKAMQEMQANIIHIIMSTGVTQQQINAAFTTPVETFKQFCDILASLVAPTKQNDIEVDIFLEYQWNIAPGQDKTYLTTPKNLKGGFWVCSASPDNVEWKEQKTWSEQKINDQGEGVVDNNNNPIMIEVEGLRYIDQKSGTVHKFVRNSSYMNSNKAIQQHIGGGNQDAKSIPESEKPSDSPWA